MNAAWDKLTAVSTKDRRSDYLCVPLTLNIKKRGRGGDAIDCPEKEPEDAKLQYDRFIAKVRSPIQFGKQRSKRALLD